MKVAWLEQIGRDDVRWAGGKAAHLGELLRQRLPVPRGFVVTADAYQSHACRSGLAERLSPLILRRDWAAVEATAAELLTGPAMDADLEAAAREAFRRLGAPEVAVRSSATAEDLPESSFAGQQSTFLHVRGEDEMLRAVQRCWASLWRQSALHYRERRSIEHLEVRMAVVVQHMVSPDVAGVLFTVDPVSRNGSRILIEATRGLGEGVVSGQVSGERYLVERAASSLVQRPRGPGLLSEPQVLELARLALQVEAHFGCPQDIEFAFENGDCLLLQARPVTGPDEPLEEIPPARKPGWLDRKVKLIADERYPLAPRPLDNFAFTRLVGGVIHAVRRGGGVITAQDEAAFRAQVWREAYRLPPVRLTWRTLTLSSRYLSLLRGDWQAWWEAGPRHTLRAVSAPVDVSELTDTALLERAERIAAAWEEALGRRFEIAGAMEAHEWLRLLVLLAVGRRDREPVVADLLTGLDNPTVEVNAALWRLSRLAREHPHVRAALRERSEDLLERTQEGRAFLRELHAFLAAYGHREGSCYYLSTPTWRHDPAPVWGLLSALVEAEEAPPDSGAGFRRYERARDRVERRLRFAPGLGRAFGFLVERLRALHAFRESSHFDLTYPLDALQEIAAEWGRRLVARGVLGAADDVYYVTHDELRGWLLDAPPPPAEVRRLVARRRATYEVANARWQAERTRLPRNGGEARGVAASPGAARGRARVIRGEHEFHLLQPGEVLVCSCANPAWTPLFTSAAAVVTETGGAASHAAIVAREYGIPAVMAVPGATRLFDGDEIFVDGSRGTVRRLHKSGGSA